MIETEKLRKTDFFSGAAIVLLGLFIISQALQMPMKDSYAGVQNVWYVSPAVFPLLVGAMLAMLGWLLIRNALKSVGLPGLKSVFAYLKSSDFIRFLKQHDTIRFYGIVLTLLVYVFILIPRIDFFLATIFFLLVFFFMFYCCPYDYPLRLIWLVLGSTLVMTVFMFSGLSDTISNVIPFSADLLIILMVAALIYTSFRKLKERQEMIAKFKLSLIIAFVAPFTIGIIFKYFLLVPMPFEGLVVSLLDAIWYADFWS